jgi:hypothetical protein
MAELSMYRGDTVTFDAVATTAAGAVQSLTGCSIWFTAKKAKGDADAAAICQLTIGSGITIVSAAGGTFTVVIPKTATEGLTRDTTLYYDVQVVDATGLVYTCDSGTIAVTTDVTIGTT